MEELQSWWQVPTIAHFCSLFRAAFHLLDFDIEELEEALVTGDSLEDEDGSFLQELIIRLLSGCYQRKDISLTNYHRYLKNFIKKHCAAKGIVADDDTTFLDLSLRHKVEVLHTLCDVRLDAGDVAEVLKNLESDSLRVEPLGQDEAGNTYWYFYGTRLYREDAKIKEKKEKLVNGEKKDGKRKRGRKSKNSKIEEESFVDDLDSTTVGAWRVACSTEVEWRALADGFRKSKVPCERDLYRTLSDDFVPEIGRMIVEKEKMVKKRLTELAPRRASSRIECLRRMRKEEQEEQRQLVQEVEEHNKYVEKSMRARQARLREERLLDRQMTKEREALVAQRREERAAGKISDGRGNHGIGAVNGRSPGRSHELVTDDLHAGMWKVLEIMQSHTDAWPFAHPVQETQAPDYYSIIQNPMDLSTIQKKLIARQYSHYSQLEADVVLMVGNCRLYNGSTSDYTKMAEGLKRVFDKAMGRYFPFFPSKNSVSVADAGDGSRPRRQASMRAIEILAQAAEEALKDTAKPTKRIVDVNRRFSDGSSSGSESSSSSSSSETEYPTKMIKVNYTDDITSVRLPEKKVSTVAESSRTTAHDFATLCKATPIRAITNATNRSEPIRIGGISNACNGTMNATEPATTAPRKTVISLLKRTTNTMVPPTVTIPVTNSQRGFAFPATQMCLATSANVTAPAQTQIVNGVNGVSNLVPLTLRKTQQPQVFYIQQQGGHQVFLQQQVLAAPSIQVGGATTHKMMLTLSPVVSQPTTYVMVPPTATTSLHPC